MLWSTRSSYLPTRGYIVLGLDHTVCAVVLFLSYLRVYSLWTTQLAQALRTVPIRNIASLVARWSFTNIYFILRSRKSSRALIKASESEAVDQPIALELSKSNVAGWKISLASDHTDGDFAPPKRSKIILFFKILGWKHSKFRIGTNLFSAMSYRQATT